ncbi:small-conductance mechanosensitive channel [Leptolyngbyaceae cyanobacterium JSC-12]|nr:small-conductance mechanosensitive channel [Leptolyngbyaceae cyanobacterium JSC-12]
MARAIAPIFNRYRWKCPNLLRGFVLWSVTLLLVLFQSAIRQPIALGQLPSLTVPRENQALPPVGVERRGTLESAAVRLDGSELFRVASPTVLNRNDPGAQIPVEIRAKQIETNLEQLINGDPDEPGLDPETLEVVIETINEQPVLFVKDANLAEPRVLLTVTNADAQYYSTNQQQLAKRWKKILEDALRQALKLRQPEALQQQISTAAKTLTATGLLTLVLGTLWTLLRHHKHKLEQRKQAEIAAISAAEQPATEPLALEARVPLLQELRYPFGLQRRLQLVQFLRWLMFWAIALVWVIGTAYSLSLFPQTRQFARNVITIPIVFLLTWFFTGLINRLTDIATDRFIQSREKEQSLTEANLQRIATIANVIKGLKMVLLYTVAVLWMLQRLQLAPASLLTLGALIALAISFAAQSLVKDLVNGFLILLEDQFRIGDNIRVGDVSGMVENLNLRVTQIRSDEGGLITLPNSLISTVENRSRTWARTDFQIEVAYNTDVDRALAIVRETVEQMAQDPEWQSVILDTQEVFGVEQLSHSGIVIRNWIKTAPLKQWLVARELRRRIKIAFDQNQIQIGIPRQVWLKNGSAQANRCEHSN